ncbi:hypothetical protein C1J03_11715 [Sulfitobacter sp. SK012]|uniref:peptidylprolyl isomerase n=1 Tax=Sulfitobacter sp. SK012 TaxID=1389005 RepID=UPI000E0B106B|nr:peptidylprolyl isomerase [Sulfitobacter sp. SK012]AXI46627.1 hypothetical protein C1J03_11715 [Sulfitobacter sp. SK012]
MLPTLNAKPEPDTQSLGKRSMLPQRVLTALAVGIEGLFGSGFDQLLLDLPINSWVGPVPSGFGLHLVTRDEIQHAPRVTFEMARDAVTRNYRYDQQRKATEALVERLEQHYVIELDDPTQ